MKSTGLVPVLLLALLACSVALSGCGGCDAPPDGQCPTGTIVENGKCISSKEVVCAPNSSKPAASHELFENVTITYTKEAGWTAPAVCAWECNADYALESGSCINTKTVACTADPTKPANSLDVPAQVTISYSTAGGWAAPAACLWACVTDFALENSQCINSKQVNCTANTTKPGNSHDVIAAVTATYTTAAGWSAPATCSWTCNTDFAPEGGTCINSKSVTCSPNTGKPANAHDVTATVPITFTSAGGWSAPAQCSWVCDTDFALETGSCINSKQANCSANAGKPANSHDVNALVSITYSSEAGWSVPAKCSWVCDSGFIINNGQCETPHPVLTIELSATSTTLPGVHVTYTATLTNTSSVAVKDGEVSFSLPDGSTQTEQFGRVEPGASIDKLVNWQVPEISALGAGEDFLEYLKRLGLNDGKEFSAQASTTWTDLSGNNYGPVVARVQTVQALPLVAANAGGTPVLLPGQTADASIVLYNLGSGAAKSVELSVYKKGDGTLASTAQSALASHENTKMHVQIKAPAVEGKGAGESDEDYRARLIALSATPIEYLFTHKWSDNGVSEYGPGSGDLKTYIAAPVLDLSLSGPSSALAGDTLNFKIITKNRGSVNSTGMTITAEFNGSGSQELNVPVST
ncbi:MAG: hypothetical protein WC889_17115, partial [Myxococcota bacterium]